MDDWISIEDVTPPSSGMYGILHEVDGQLKEDKAKYNADAPKWYEWETTFFGKPAAWKGVKYWRHLTDTEIEAIPATRSMEEAQERRIIKKMLNSGLRIFRMVKDSEAIDGLAMIEILSANDVYKEMNKE